LGISALALGLAAAGLALAQDDLPANPEPLSETVAGVRSLFNPIDQVSFWLAVIFLVFGFVVLLLQLYLLTRVRDLQADDVAKNCALTVVVIASVVLLIAGYNSEQLGPVFGLFGTMIGYVLGRTSLARREEKRDDSGL
jgi:NhaP-type Na+/H+ or K+/H+ antiporter